jgi:hypothetical protein
MELVQNGLHWPVFLILVLSLRILLSDSKLVSTTPLIKLTNQFFDIRA